MRIQLCWEEILPFVLFNFCSNASTTGYEWNSEKRKACWIRTNTRAWVGLMDKHNSLLSKSKKVCHLHSFRSHHVHEQTRADKIHNAFIMPKFMLAASCLPFRVEVEKGINHFFQVQIRTKLGYKFLGVVLPLKFKNHFDNLYIRNMYKKITEIIKVNFQL